MNKTDYLKTIAENIRRLRGRMSQNELAKKAGISRATLARAEKGKSIELNKLLKIADALGIHPSDLFISEKDRAEISYKHKLLIDRFTKFLELEKREG